MRGIEGLLRVHIARRADRDSATPTPSDRLLVGAAPVSGIDCSPPGA
ncbi:hypothetical protein ACF081_28740 [Streptomyces longwoodensis]